jgi:hypothetical protein
VTAEVPTKSCAVRSAARVVRVGGDTAFVVFERWRNAAITVSLPCGVLEQTLGLGRHQLLGAQASARIIPDAVLDSDVCPTAWRPVTALPAQAA